MAFRVSRIPWRETQLYRRTGPSDSAGARSSSALCLRCSAGSMQPELPLCGIIISLVSPDSISCCWRFQPGALSPCAIRFPQGQDRVRDVNVEVIQPVLYKPRCDRVHIQAGCLLSSGLAEDSVDRDIKQEFKRFRPTASASRASDSVVARPQASRREPSRAEQDRLQGRHCSIRQWQPLVLL